MKLTLKHFHKQIGANECWFACFLMVYDHVVNNTGIASDYGRKKDEIAQKDFTQYVTEINGDSPFDIGAGADVVTELLEEEVSGLQYGREDHSMDRFVNKNTDLNGTLAAVERSLELGYPAIIGIDRGNGGHFCVVVGVEDGELIIVDPMGDGKPERIEITKNISSYIYYRG